MRQQPWTTVTHHAVSGDKHSQGSLQLSVTSQSIFNFFKTLKPDLKTNVRTKESTFSSFPLD